jgi:hypothetical protein
MLFHDARKVGYASFVVGEHTETQVPSRPGHAALREGAAWASMRSRSAFGRRDRHPLEPLSGPHTDLSPPKGK